MDSFEPGGVIYTGIVHDFYTKKVYHRPFKCLHFSRKETAEAVMDIIDPMTIAKSKLCNSFCCF